MTKLVLSGLSVLMISSTPTFAQISITTTVDATAKPPALNVRMAVTNQGLEKAHQIHVTLQVADAIQEIAGPTSIAPGSTHILETQVAIGTLTLGRHPLFVRVTYADRSGYPFSAPLVSTFVIEQDAASDLLGNLEIEQLTDSAILRLHCRNLSETERQFHLTLFTAQELAVDVYDSTLTLGGQAEHDTEFLLRNSSALPGSVYPVYAVLEREENNRHSTYVIQGRAEVVASLPFTAEYRWWIVGIALVLLASGAAVTLLNVRSNVCK